MKIRNQLPISNLKKLRKDKKKTQEQLAEMLGCTAKTYANYERIPGEKGYQEPYIKHLIKLADFFEVSTDYILGFTDCKEVSNHYISEKTGLSEAAIIQLTEMKQKEDDNLLRYKPMPSALPVINQMLSAPSDDAENFFKALNLYLHPEYTIPVRHDSNAPGGYAINDHPKDQTIISNYLSDSAKTYLLHFAKSHSDLSDNVPVEVTNDFIKAAALNQMNIALEHIAIKTKQQ